LKVLLRWANSWRYPKYLPCTGCPDERYPK
jgi:hypothetical protein